MPDNGSLRRTELRIYKPEGTKESKPPRGNAHMQIRERGGEGKEGRERQRERKREGEKKRKSCSHVN